MKKETLRGEFIEWYRKRFPYDERELRSENLFDEWIWPRLEKQVETRRVSDEEIEMMAWADEEVIYKLTPLAAAIKYAKWMRDLMGNK